MRLPRPVLVLGLTALTATLVAAPAAARGGPPATSGPAPDWVIPATSIVDETGKVIAVAPSDLAASIATEAVQTVHGEVAGAAYVGQKPDDWNGRLVVWAHGYRGEFEDDPYLTVDPPPLYDELVADGTAWIASSYRRNSYDPGVGVLDTKNVTRRAAQLFGQPDHTYVAGVSMGGHVIGAAIEQHPELFDGALPACGVMGDVELFDYFLDYNLGAAALANRGLAADEQIEVSYPDDDWLEDEVPQIRRVLSFVPEDDTSGPVTRNVWASGGAFGPNVLTELGSDFKEFVELGSGGERGVIYDAAWDYWHLLASPTGDFFFELGEGDGTIAGRAGVVGQNIDTEYESEYPGFGTLDDEIARVRASNRVRNAQGTKPAPIITGTPTIPVLTMHTIGDLFVPIEMQQIYAREVAANGLSHNLVQRAVRDVGHCTFSDDEWQEAYADLFRWVEDGVPAVGEDLVGNIGDPTLGFAWTINDGTPAARGGVRVFGGRPALVD